MKLDPRHLAQLSMIVEAGSFQGAADRLGLSQPALSRNIAMLEARLNAPLFDRRGRRAIPTELGRRLASSGLSIRIAEEQASAYSKMAATGMAGQLRIGAPPIIAGGLLGPILANFIRANPNCTTELRVGLIHELRSMLETGQIDLAIAPQGLNASVAELDFISLISDPIGIICRREHPLMQQDVVSPEDLSAQRWIAHSRDSVMRRKTEGALMEMGVERLLLACETDSISSAVQIVAGTDLLAAMPRVSSGPYLGPEVTFLATDHPQFHRMIGVVRHRSAPRDALVDNFVAHLRDET